MDTYFGNNKFIGPPTIIKKSGRGGKATKIVNTLELSEESNIEITVRCKHGERQVRWSRRFQSCRQCTSEAGAYNTSLKGREITWGDAISKAKKGKLFSDKHKKALSMAQYGIGDETDWPGFYEKSEVHQMRDSSEYREFRDTVMRRDNFTCQVTGLQGNLAVHHIEAVSLNKSRIFDVTNGITILQSVHDAFHAKYGNGHNTPEQWNDFISNFDRIAK